MGKPSVGKSHALVDLGAGTSENHTDATVIHFSEEMSHHQCLRRYARRMSYDKSTQPVK